MKQRLGEKKARLCADIGGKPYRACYTRGGWAHGLAECWFGDGETLHDADWVNYRTRESEAYLRDGQRVKAG